MASPHGRRPLRARAGRAAALFARSAALIATCLSCREDAILDPVAPRVAHVDVATTQSIAGCARIAPFT
jgi:hypothetical protein